MTFEEWVRLHNETKKVLGPWTKHEHAFGCDCGYYPADHPLRNPNGWWFRPTVHNDGNDESGFLAFSEEDKKAKDTTARNEGRILCDE